MTHTWEDVEARLGRLILAAAAALADLTGDAWMSGCVSSWRGSRPGPDMNLS
ncbi:hypothetical protein [Streptomyces niveiscabiei]|uniref:hypothetical protein n=1 Tax=Streptomyces niveiscabiei TaxID=164115 RepID=UPI0038F7952B